MSIGGLSSRTGFFHVGQEELGKRWGWFLFLGIALVILGFIAIGTPVLMTVASMLVFGWLLVIGAVIEIVTAFGAKRWRGFFVDLVVALVYAVAGVVLLTNPLKGAVFFTLVIAIYLLVGGVFRIAAALATHYHHWGWLLFGGIVDVVLGVMIWRQWPSSSFWVIGLFIGIDMIFQGWALVMLGMMAKNLSKEAPAA